MGRLAVFDLDGTLIDSRRDLAEAANVARRAVALPPLPMDTVVSYVGDGIDALIARLIVEPAHRAEAKAAFAAYYVDHCSVHTRLYAGVLPALAALADAGWLLAVATNKPLRFAQRILGDLGLATLVGERLRGGDHARKPDPGQLFDLLAVTGADPASSWMIGDHHTDVLAGRAAGMRILWCEWGLGHADGHGVDATATSPADWPRVLGSPA